MRSFRDITEAKETVVFGFGRFNPPTTGHEKLIEKVASIAGSNPFFIYPSHTTGPTDPLLHAKKVAWMRKMFPKYKKNIIADRNAKTAIQIAEKLYKDGYKNLIMVAGSDRLKEFETLLNKYNDAPDKKGNQLFKFDSVRVISAGARDPDAEGVSGMSASKMRTAAEKGDFDSFKTGIPSILNDADKKKLYFEVRKAMGIREEREMGDDYDSLRDAYLTGKIWNVGESVEANGISGEVVRKGTNYLSFVAEDGKVHKAWLHEIELDEAKSPLQKLRDFDKSRVAAGKPPIFTDKKPPKFVRMKRAGQMTIMNVPTDEIDKFEKKGYKIIEDLVGVKPMSGPTGQIFALKSEEVELDERNYAKEYANYQGTPEQIARRSSRNKARRAMGDKAVKGQDVGHKDNDPLNNDPENLRNEDPSKNRREPRLRDKEVDEIRASRPKAGGPSYIEKNIKKHIELTNKYIKQGMSKDAASKKAYKEIVKEDVEIDERNYAKEYANYQEDKEDDDLQKTMRIATSKMDVAKRIKQVRKQQKSSLDKVKDKDKKTSMKKTQDTQIKNIKNLAKSDLKRMKKEDRVKEESELDEVWYKDVMAKMSQITHPSGWDKLAKEFAAGMNDPEHRKHSSSWASDVARKYRGIDGRQLIKYINKLVDAGKLPKELKAEYETQTFKSFVEILNKNADQGDYIDDFVDSDAPQFKGKSKKKRVAMAVAAFKSKNENDNNGL